MQLSSFVGRAGELAELAAAMARSPLVTVTGPGGVGKTRLALQAAADQLPSFSDGAWLCELHPAGDGETMAQAVLAALRARPRPGLSTAGSVVEFLRTRSALLLVLDNCEHLAAAAAALAADILRGCPGVRILATSQQPLGVGGEQVFGLRPLSLPPPDAGMAAAAASDAVSLFAQRAAAARSDFSLSPSNVAAVGEICRRLDGIPLAIELAAARVAALRPAEIAGLLDERFRLLTRGRADAARRQQTLQATVEWSYALLGEAERRVFDCLGVFPASFDAAAAAAVAGTDGLQRWDVLDSLTSLVGKSLVAEEEGPGQTSRYRLLETMRAYARQQLAAGELGRLRRRHAGALRGVRRTGRAGTARPGAAGVAAADPGRARQPAGRRHLGPGQRRPGAPAGLPDRRRPGRLRRHIAQCRRRLGRRLPGARSARARPSCAAWSSPRRRGARSSPATFRWRDGGPRTPCTTRQPAIRSASAMLRLLLSQSYPLTGQPERGASIAREGRQEVAELGIEIFVGYFLAAEAMAWTAAGDYAAARPPAMEAVEVARRVQNPGLSAWAFCTAAGAIWPGDPQTALTLIEDSLALTRAGAFDPALDTALTWAGFIRARNGDLPGALAALQEAMAQQHADGNRLLLNMTLQITAVVLARLGEAEPAVVLSGAFSAHFPPGISAVHQDVTMGIEEAQSLARHALGEAAYRRRARPGRRDGRGRARRVRAGRVPAARRPARRTRRAGTGITAPPGAAGQPGMTVWSKQDAVSQHSRRG